MGSILNIGLRSMLANQAALQTVGNNISNVNTPGYSRQSVVLSNVPGQYTGSGYYGKGVEITTVEREYSDFLIKQATLYKSLASSDSVRYSNLQQLENIFQGGTDGLGSAVNDLLNAFSDIVSSPSDLTARTVVLTRADEMASRFQQMAQQLYELQQGVSQQLDNDVTVINSLASQIGSVNDQIARAVGSGHAPNDLLDQRDQLISELNKYIQTSQIPADDGTIGIFIGGSQPLVLGTRVSPLSISSGDDAFNLDRSQRTLNINVAGASYPIDDAMLGGGEVAGLLRFHNADLVDASNLLGRLALTVATSMNEQQQLGLDLDGAVGGPLFNIKPDLTGIASSSTRNSAFVTDGGKVEFQVTDPSRFTPANYEVVFTSATTGYLVRQSDGRQLPAFDLSNPATLDYDGFTLAVTAPPAPSTATPASGHRFLVQPFDNAAASITTAIGSPRELAMANPLSVAVSPANQGTLTLTSLTVRQAGTGLPSASATLTFNGTNFTYVDSNPPGATTTVAYTPGAPLTLAIGGWTYELALKGIPATGDTLTVGKNIYTQADSGNARAMLALRDANLVDGGPLTDGYAGLISVIGVKSQSASSALAVSSNISTTLEKDRAAVSGVNLDEEAARMLQFQQAYQAAGKMMQIAQSVFDTLLDSVGR